jgi:hypothetical protein
MSAEERAAAESPAATMPSKKTETTLDSKAATAEAIADKQITRLTSAVAHAEAACKESGFESCASEKHAAEHELACKKLGFESCAAGKQSATEKSEAACTDHGFSACAHE